MSSPDQIVELSDFQKMEMSHLGIWTALFNKETEESTKLHFKGNINYTASRKGNLEHCKGM